MADQIRVQGLRDLLRELRQADQELPAEIRQANLDAASYVAPFAHRRVPQGPHQGGGRIVSAAASVRAGGTQRTAYVAMGGARSPHALPVNFGGTIARFHSDARTHIPRREALYAGIAEAAEHAEFLDQWWEAVERVTRQAFPRRF